MISSNLLLLLASIEEAGGLKEVKSTDGMKPQAKLTLDKQSYEIVQAELLGFLRIDSETKSVGLAFTIECGDIT